MANKILNNAKSAKKDEFYTQLVDIENELKHYKEHFKDKVVLCNCDDPRVSNFFHYFSYNFEQLGLKKLITTCYKSQACDLFSQNDSERAIWLEYNGDKNGNNVPDPEEIGINYLKGDGDFRSKECIELLKQADIVVTNPPFSLFREYVAQLVEYDKKFIIIGSHNAIHYSEIFPLIKNDKIWLGYNTNQTMTFAMPDSYVGEEKEFKYGDKIEKKKVGKVPGITWFTNLDIAKRHEEIILFRSYNAAEYHHYDNYDAINVDKIADIPMDYYGVMGVPDTFVDFYNPEQFELIGVGSGSMAASIGVTKNYRGRTDIALTIDGVHKCPYSRILIRRRQAKPYPQSDEQPTAMAAETE
ncbi:MAG: adenine-specific methyltransferase EcoRI family protein [Bacteroidales bacterium]|nr:adenine-specific methyltransferase EcoRI family protein [Bacteroidales bacterium]